jgi:hypothetical protein
VPDASCDAATVYIVLEDFGKLSRAYRATDDNFLSGQYSRPVRVVASTPTTTRRGMCRKTAHAVAEWASLQGRHLSGGTRRFQRSI